MIRTQSVTAWATVEGSEFMLTEANINRTTGRTAAQAVVKGIVEDVDTLDSGDWIEVYIAATNADQTPQTETQVFGGFARSATQNEEGLVEITVFDQRYRLHNKKVSYGGEEEELSWNVLIKIMNDIFFGVVAERSLATTRRPYVAPRDKFPSGDNTGNWKFKKSRSVTDALRDLVSSIGGYMWVDRKGILNISPYPDPNTDWKTPFITKLNTGEDTEQASRVLFEGSNVASEFGLGQATVYNKASTPSEALLGEQDDDLPPEITISDQNATTSQEADSQAYNEAVRRDQQKDMGEMTIIGNSDIELFDHAIIPELDFEIGGIERPIPNDLQSGRFKVDAITHKVNNQDGFLTTLDLSPAIDSSLKKCRVPASSGISAKYLKQYENTTTEEKISGVDDSSGFVLDFNFNE